MKTRAFVLRTEGSKVWLSVEAESCSICDCNTQDQGGCSGCGCKGVFDNITAKNSRNLPLKPGMKVAASFTAGRALLQAAAAFGLPLILALVAYLAAPALPVFAKPVSALVALIATALFVCAGSSFMQKKFPRAYGELEITEILEESNALCFPALSENQTI